MTQQRVNRSVKTRRRESEARRGAHISCPHCDAAANIRSSHVMSATMRQLQYDCSNAECGASFSATLELNYHLSLPAQPNPAVALPMSSRIDRAAMRALLDVAGTVTPTQSAMPLVNGDLFDSSKSSQPLN